MVSLFVSDGTKRRRVLRVHCLRGCLFTSILVLCAASPLHAQNWAEKMFDRTNVDFGVVARGADTRYHLTIKNIYQPDVHIADVRTSCGCTAATPSKRTLATYETATIEIKMDTLKFTREKNSSVTVVFDQPMPAEVVIPIRAYIRTDVVFSPGQVQFGAVPQGSEQTRTISLAYAGRDDWAVTGIQSANPDIEARVVETSRGNGRVNYDLVVALKPGAPAGDLRTQLLLTTTDTHRPPIPLMVEGTIEPEYTVNPSVVSFGVLNPGETKTVNVVVRGRKPFQIDTIEGAQHPENFTIRTSEEARVVHVVPVTITAPTQPGTLQEEFTVKLEGGAAPCRFKAYGKIAGPDVSTSDTAPNASSRETTFIKQANN